MAPRGWFREYFTDHLHYRPGPGQWHTERDDNVWANTRKDKPKVICTACLDHRVLTVQIEEEQQAAQDASFLARERNDIILSRKCLCITFAAY